MFKHFCIFFWLITVISCTNSTVSEQINIDERKAEIITTELDFARMARDSGLSKAFVSFASENAVISRKDTVLKGKDAIGAFYSDPSFDDVSLQWKPDFVHVSNCGTLGYTYGNFTFSRTDSSGNKIARKGIFHTVWERQEDGKWKYTWD